MKYNELDEIMDKIELLFLNNTSINENHNGQYIEHKDFLDETKELLKKRYYSSDNIKRYNVTPIINNNQMTGISHQEDNNGVFVYYNDIRNLIEDNIQAIENLKKSISLLEGKHRISENGI
jgi:hypothetical protein